MGWERHGDTSDKMSLGAELVEVLCGTCQPKREESFISNFGERDCIRRCSWACTHEGEEGRRPHPGDRE